MSYIKRDDITVPEGWTAVEFPDGSLARVRCDKKTVTNGVCYKAQAAAIDAQGTVLLDALGRPVETDHTKTMLVEQVELLGDVPITKAVLLLVLGEREETDLFPVPDSTRTSPKTNIRSAIAAAAVSGAADAGAAL